MPGQLLDSLFLGNAIGQTSITVNPNQTGAPLFPNVLASAGAIPSGTTNVMYAASKLRDPHTQQYHFAVERPLGIGTTVSVNAIRQHGFKLWTLRLSSTSAWCFRSPCPAGRASETAKRKG